MRDLGLVRQSAGWFGNDAVSRSQELGFRSMQGKQKKALFWLLVEVLGAQGIPFVVFLAIARIIGPMEYGAFALAITFVGVLNIIIFQGVAEALIRL